MSQQVAYASAARTATPTAAVINTGRAKAVRIVWDTTAVTSTPSTVMTVDAIDSLSGKAVNLLTSVAVATAVVTTLEIGPGVTAAANVAANKFLPDSIRITMTHGNANSTTYSVAVHITR